MFQPHASDPVKQLPIVIDAISLFMAGLDGNGFYGLVSDDMLHHHQQYDEDSIEILTLGIKAYMEKHDMPKKIQEDSEWPLAKYLNVVLKQLTFLKKQIIVYNKKKRK